MTAIAIVLVVAGSGVAWLAGALGPCCGTTPAALVVTNLGSAPVQVSWRTAGLLGTPLLGSSGSAMVPGCAASTPDLRPGARHTIEIRSVTETFTTVFDAPTAEHPEGGVAALIAGDGSVNGGGGAVAVLVPAECGP